MTHRERCRLAARLNRPDLMPKVGGGVDPAPNMEMNTGSQGTPTWSSIMGAGGEWRFADVHVAANTASASWPQVTRPGSVTQMNYLHAYTADATGDWVAGAISGGTPPANYNQCRWNPAGGTFASAPVLTAYPTTAHGAPTLGDGSILGGHTTDTGASQRSYLKATAYGYGFQTTVQTPGAAPTGAFPTATDGTTGAVTTATAAWSNAAGAWQGMQGDTTGTWIASGGSSWDGTAAKYWYFMLALFSGPNMTPGTLTPVLSLKYTWT